MSKKRRLLVLISVVYVSLLVFTRVFNIDHSARFTGDESSDLARMHEYWQAKKITLVGPISNDKIKVFGSLTYYMLMPFAVLGKFDPISPVYGMSFWGVLTALLFIYLVKQINTRLLLFALPLTLVSYPLLESSRWAWNPHLMPFWFVAALVALQYRHWIAYSIAGVSLGLAVHNHYIALVPALTLIGIEVFCLIRSQRYRLFLPLVLSFACMLAPFVIFDLRHPPGLFTTTYFSRTPHVDVEGSSISMFGKILRNIAVAGYTMVRHPWLSTIFLVLSGILLSVDLLKKDFHNLRWLFPAIALIVVGVALEAFETRYFLAAIMFYLMWLFLPRVKKAAVLQKVILSFLILASIVSVRPVMTRPEIPPDIYTIRSITTIIRKLYADNPDIKNANITAVASDDLDMLSGKYRDLFSIYGISFRAASEYDASEHLFALSQSPEEVVRSSESYPLRVFGQTKLRGVYPVTNSDWKVYWFSY